MRLVTAEIEMFKNFIGKQSVDIESDVTCLLGKNESGKTTILKALHRLNPADGDARDFDAVREYPMRHVSADRKRGVIEATKPITGIFELEAADREKVEALIGAPLPESTRCIASVSYANKRLAHLQSPLADVVALACSTAGIDDADHNLLGSYTTVEEVVTTSKAAAKELLDSGDNSKSKAFKAFPGALEKYATLTGSNIDVGVSQQLWALLPKFFYFSDYDMLPGECDLNALTAKVASGVSLSASDETVLALLNFADEQPEDFLDENYDRRKAELQAAGAGLSEQVFKYWKSNTDLAVVFDTDMELTPEGNPNDTRHRILKVLLRDDRHGGVETNFATRSAGFQWFFSFLAAFSKYQGSTEDIIVLLDEPGMSLHGEAQAEFLKFIYAELGDQKQTVYTTHSQHMVDTSRYEKIRAVHDRAIKSDASLGVEVTGLSLKSDRATLLPAEAALGYSVAQNLFIGAGPHLAVEGSSDLVYLTRMSEHVIGSGSNGLDPRFAILPAGGAGNMPVFMALLGRRLTVSALMDGKRTSKYAVRVMNAVAENGVSESAIVFCEQVAGLPCGADIEDLFTDADYLTLFNKTFGAKLTPSDLAGTNEPLIRRLEQHLGESFDHALPAHTLVKHYDELASSFSAETLDRFAALFELLNNTIESAVDAQPAKQTVDLRNSIHAQP